MDIQEIKLLQKVLFKGGITVGSAVMLSKGTQYEGDFKQLWNILEKLNNKLVGDIRKFT